MSDQANPIENTEENTEVAAENAQAPVETVQSEEALETEFAEQGETVDAPREGEFEPSNGRPVQTAAEAAANSEVSDEPSDEENVVTAEVTTETTSEAEEAMAESFAEQGETVGEANTFAPGPESETVAQPADDSVAQTVADPLAGTDGEQPTGATGGAAAGDASGDSREVRVERTSGPAMFELPERMARNRRIYDAKIEDIHYKNIPMLVRFLDTYGRILSRRRTGVSAKMQRRVVQSVKLARELSLLPYTNEHNRLSRKNR